ncbi:MAG: hypothetical protein V3U71_01435 [Cocleimonas sp.]
MKFSLKNSALLTTLAFSSLYPAEILLANSCSKADITFYLQKGFSHDQVMKLCGTTTTAAQASSVQTQRVPQAPNTNYTSITQRQSNSTRETQVYLEAAFKANDVMLTPPLLTYTSKECVEHGPQNNTDLNTEACIDSKITINLNGLKIIKASKGIFLIKNTELIVEGNVKREYINIDSIRRQDRNIIETMLPTNPKQINLPIKSGINPDQVAKKLKPYIFP